MVHLGHHVRRQRQDSNVAPKAGFRIFNDTFAFFEVQHQRQDKETRVQMLSHIFDPRRRSAAHVIHHRSAYHPPSHPNLAAHADPAFRARTHLGKRSDKSCLLLFLPLALPENHYQAPFGHYQTTTKPPLATTKPLPSPCWPLPSHYQAPFGHYQATTKPPLATTNPLPSPLWPTLIELNSD